MIFSPIEYKSINSKYCTVMVYMYELFPQKYTSTHSLRTPYAPLKHVPYRHWGVGGWVGLKIYSAIN